MAKELTGKLNNTETDSDNITQIGTTVYMGKEKKLRVISSILRHFPGYHPNGTEDNLSSQK